MKKEHQWSLYAFERRYDSCSRVSNAKNETYLYNYDSKNGRRLTSLQKWINMISYAYDETGLRTEKSTNTNRTYFDRDASGNLVHEFRDYSGYLGEDSHLYYYYNANGNIGSISYNGVRYAFRKNLQGDVIAILDTSGNVVARYTYDAWGKVLSVTDANGNANTSSTFIGNVNPIRYRGYYYDTETGWYYLRTRYYDPQVKRFLNSDMIAGEIGSLGYNLFSYCKNDPVNRIDSEGALSWWASEQMIHGVQRQPGGGYNPAYLGAAPADSCVETVPDKLDLFAFTGTHSSYTLETVKTTTHTVSSQEAAEIASESAGMQAINDLISTAPITATASIILGEFVVVKSIVSFVGTAVGIATTYSQAKKNNIHVDSGTYHTIVAIYIYSNDTGEKIVLNRTYSNYTDSYLNTGWGVTRYDPSKTIDDYSQIGAYYIN